MDEPFDKKIAGPQGRAAAAQPPASSPPETPPERPPETRPVRHGRRRLTSVVGTLAALLLGLCFFLPWIQVDPRLGEPFLRGIDESVAGLQEPGPVEQDFQQLAASLKEQGALTGMDLIYWVRTAGAFGDRIESAQERAADAPTQRVLVIARLLLNTLLFVALLLAAYFVFHGFRRVTAPILILCVLVGATAVVLAGGLHYAHHLVQDALGSAADGVANGPGSKVLLLGGAGLVLAGTFGVSGRNFIRVYAGVGLTAVGLYLLVLRYFETGTLP
jgi:hypothetical protein